MINLTKETVTLIKDKLSTVAILTIPGMTVLDVVLGRGLFGQQPSNIFEFTIYLFWCISLSVFFLVPVVSTAYRCRYLINSLQKKPQEKPCDDGEGYLFTYGFLISMAGALLCIVFFYFINENLQVSWFSICGLTNRFVAFSTSMFFANITSFLFARIYWRHIEQKDKDKKEWVKKKINKQK